MGLGFTQLAFYQRLSQSPRSRSTLKTTQLHLHLICRGAHVFLLAFLPPSVTDCGLQPCWGSHRIFSDKFMHAGAWECLIRTRSIKALPTGRLVRWFARSSSPEPRLFPSQSTRPFLSKDVGLNCFLTPGRKLAGKLLSNRITSVPWHGWFLWACSMRC